MELVLSRKNGNQRLSRTDCAGEIAANMSMKRLWWSLLATTVQTKSLPLVFARSCFKILHSKSCPCSEIATVMVSTTERTLKLMSSGPRSNQFVTAIFDALKQNSTLKTVRLNSYSPLTETTKEVLLDSIQKNKTIRNAHTKFKHPDDRLDFCWRAIVHLTCNRKKWIVRLADPRATKRQLMEINYEALHCKAKRRSPFLLCIIFCAADPM
jgi:hypothetical protein